MRNKNIILTLCSFFLLTANLSYANETDKILVTAGNATLTESGFTELIAEMPPQLQKMLNEQPQLKLEMLQNWANFSILAQEAEATGFGDKKTAQRKIKEIRNRVMVQELIESQTTKTSVSDEEITTFYNDNKSNYAIPEQVKAQHILVHIKDFNDSKDVELANAKIKHIQAKLQAGESFAILAKQYSDDAVSKVKGGNVGFFSRGEMVPPFEEFAFNKTVGDLSEAITTKYGLHIIKITAKIKAGFSPLDKEKENIRLQLIDNKNRVQVETLLAELKEKYKIKIY